MALQLQDLSSTARILTSSSPSLSLHSSSPMGSSHRIYSASHSPASTDDLICDIHVGGGKHQDMQRHSPTPTSSLHAGSQSPFIPSVNNSKTAGTRHSAHPRYAEPATNTYTQGGPLRVRTRQHTRQSKPCAAPYDKTNTRCASSLTAGATPTSEVLACYGISHPLVCQYRYLAYKANYYGMRRPQELPQSLYANGAKVHTSNELDITHYETFPSLKVLSVKDYEQIPDYEQLAFPEVKFAQKVSFVFQVHLPLLISMYKPVLTHHCIALLACMQFPGQPKYIRQVSVLSTKNGKMLQPTKGALGTHAAFEMCRFLVSYSFYFLAQTMRHPCLRAIALGLATEFHLPIHAGAAVSHCDNSHF